jgi:hypothetical protein
LVLFGSYFSSENIPFRFDLIFISYATSTGGAFLFLSRSSFCFSTSALIAAYAAAIIFYLSNSLSFLLFLSLNKTV